MGALKAALTAIFNAHGDNDFSSTSKVPYFNSSNNPYGMATPAKLASVLGVELGGILNSGENANNLTKLSFRVVYTSSIPNISNLPSDAVYGYIVTLPIGANRIVQEYYGLDDFSYKKKRKSENGGNTWNAWT